METGVGVGVARGDAAPSTPNDRLGEISGRADAKGHSSGDFRGTEGLFEAFQG